MCWSRGFWTSLSSFYNNLQTILKPSNQSQNWYKLLILFHYNFILKEIQLKRIKMKENERKKLEEEAKKEEFLLPNKPFFFQDRFLVLPKYFVNSILFIWNCKKWLFRNLTLKVINLYSEGFGSFSHLFGINSSGSGHTQGSLPII